MKTSIVKYEVFKIIGEYAITIDDGQKIQDLIRASLDKKEPIELDFANVKIVAPPFLSLAIGRLYKDYTPDEVEQFVKIENMMPLDMEILDSIKEASYKYFTNAVYRNRLEATLHKIDGL